MRGVLLSTATAAAILAGQIRPGATDGASRQGEQPSAAEWQRRGLDLGYNLDRREAIEAFRRATEIDPHSSNAYRLLAAAAWTAILFDQGAVTVEDYLGTTAGDATRPAPDPALAELFRSSIDRAVALAEQDVAARPTDTDAHYQVGAAYGLRAAYAGTVEGRVLGSLGAARRAYREHLRLLAAAGHRQDAGLIVGLYRYAVSTLPAPRRWGAYLAGLDGGRQEGLALVETAAAYPSDVQSQAAFTLILLYNREARYEDALRVIQNLQARYPRNRLLWLEAGGTALRAGRPSVACAALEAGLARFAADPRPKAPGEEARWRYAYGSALVALGNTVRATRELTGALGLATRDWLRGRIHIEIGKLADRSGDQPRAITEYREADALCRRDRDPRCADEARALLTRKGTRR